MIGLPISMIPVEPNGHPIAMRRYMTQIFYVKHVSRHYDKRHSTQGIIGLLWWRVLRCERCNGIWAGIFRLTSNLICEIPFVVIFAGYCGLWTVDCGCTWDLRADSANESSKVHCCTIEQWGWSVQPDAKGAAWDMGHIRSSETKNDCEVNAHWASFYQATSKSLASQQ